MAGNEALLAGVVWKWDLDGELPRIRGNPHDLQQVFLNLFLNAIQAMPEGGDLGVRARLDSEGVGIQAEHLDEIFDPFFTTKQLGEGTGLGLSVSHGIIEKHGGRIVVESEPGHGTTFSVYLPTTEVR